MENDEPPSSSPPLMDLSLSSTEDDDVHAQNEEFDEEEEKAIDEVIAQIQMRLAPKKRWTKRSKRKVNLSPSNKAAEIVDRDRF